MPSQGRHKRHYASDDEGASSFAASRGDKTGSDTHTHSNHHPRQSEKRRHSPSRADMREDVTSSSSRTYRENDERRTADDRYDYTPSKDGRRHGRRDDNDQRAKDSYPTSRESYYSSSSKQPADSYDRDRDMDDSHHDTSAWTPRKDNKDYSRSRWGVKDGRGGQRSDRGRGGYDMNDRFNDSRNRDDLNSRDRQRDNGWGSRRSTNGEAIANTLSSTFSDHPQDDRTGYSYASAPSSSSRQDAQRKARKKHKKPKTEKRAREWRTDDTHLNNWTRRDSAEYSRKTQKPERRHYRSSSPSTRSRSPAESYYSRPSSRGRSHSSDTPRRRRADSRTRRSPSPYDRFGKGPSRRWSRSPSRSPPPRRRYAVSPVRSPVRSPWSPEPRRRRSRGRSLSISSGLSRSPSMSPRQRSRTVHRLPVATSVEDLRSKIRTRAPLDLPQRPATEQRNGDGASGGKRRDRRKRSNRQSDYMGDSKDMPPPSVPTLSSNAAESLVHRTDHASDTRSHSLTTPLTAKGIKIGFKPIAQASSSLKRFFPGDDDDDDVNDLQSQRQTVTSERPPVKSSPMTVQTERIITQDTSRHFNQNGNSYTSTTEIRAAQTVSRQPTDMSDSPMILSPPRSVPHSLEAQRPRNRRDQDQPRHVSSRRARDNYYEGPFEETIHAHDVTMPPTPEHENAEFYKIVSQVGEGTFGKVYKARNTSSGRFVALKRIRMEAEKDGFPVTAMREIKLLQSLRHENVVRLYEMMVSNGSVYMVFEYMDHDLTGVLSQTQFTFNDAHLKSLCQQMLSGLAYLHHKGVIHRDIKGSNILINNHGELKLADFGLARFYQKRRKSDYTNRVITLWYRPPELLFGTTVYGPEVDMWSAGCIMLELFTKKPIFQGNDEIHQLDVVYKILGTPTPECWPGVTSLPWYELVKPKDHIPNHFRELFQKWLSPAALDLAERLLAYDPARRISALEAMEAPYFLQEQPPPDPPVGLATLEGEWHELETKRERAKKRRKTENST